MNTERLVSHDSFQQEPPGKEQKEGGCRGYGGKNKWKLSEVNTWAVSREQNE